MTKTKPNYKIVCDVIGCGGLSAYRLTFHNGADIFLCKRCFKELKDFLKTDEDEDDKISKKK